MISEIIPWDYTNFLAISQHLLIVDAREKEEFQQTPIENSISAPRGIPENACLWVFFETIPELAAAQHWPILLVCRSAYRSVFAALSMQQPGFEKVTSLKLGLNGPNVEDIPLLDSDYQRIDQDTGRWLILTRLSQGVFYCAISNPISPITCNLIGGFFQIRW